MDMVLGWMMLRTWNLELRGVVSRSNVIVGSGEAGHAAEQMGTLMKGVGGRMIE